MTETELRDAFAMVAVQGLLASPNTKPTNPTELARLAFVVAEAMMNARPR